MSSGLYFCGGTGAPFTISVPSVPPERGYSQSISKPSIKGYVVIKFAISAAKAALATGLAAIGERSCPFVQPPTEIKIFK
ncbi:hypothetical protein D3C87_1050010 [compost metagenome]